MVQYRTAPFRILGIPSLLRVGTESIERPSLSQMHITYVKRLFEHEIMGGQAIKPSEGHYMPSVIHEQIQTETKVMCEIECGT